VLDVEPGNPDHRDGEALQDLSMLGHLDLPLDERLLDEIEVLDVARDRERARGAVEVHERRLGDVLLGDRGVRSHGEIAGRAVTAPCELVGGEEVIAIPVDGPLRELAPEELPDAMELQARGLDPDAGRERIGRLELGAESARGCAELPGEPLDRVMVFPKRPARPTQLLPLGELEVERREPPLDVGALPLTDLHRCLREWPAPTDQGRRARCSRVAACRCR
jgi:hypothetical protein